MIEFPSTVLKEDRRKRRVRTRERERERGEREGRENDVSTFEETNEGGSSERV